MKNKLLIRIFLCFAVTLMLFSGTVGGIFLLIYTKNTIRTYRSDFIQKSEALAHTLSVYFENNLPEDCQFEDGLNLEMKQANLGLGLYLDFMDDIALSNLWIVDRETQTIHVEFGKYNISYSSIPTDVRVLIDSAMEGETAISERWSGSFLKKNFVIAAPIKFSDNTTFAAVVIHARSKAMYNNVVEAWYVLIGSLLMTLLVSLIPSYLFSRMIVRPLKKMADTTNEMTEGNYTVHTGIRQRDEVGVLANNIDVLASRLEIASRESMQLEQMRKNYISNISHELRTPVAVIRSSLEALCDGIVAKKDMVEDYHREMLSESIHLDRMVNDLLELSRLQNPDYSIEKRGVNLVSVAEDAVRTIRHIANKAGNTILLEKDTSSFPFCGDYGRLRQMLVTVLDNAVKFSWEGEPIRVTVAVDNDHCIIAVANKGAGISPEDLPHIFEEYYTQWGENNSSGTGLGLAIAKRIAQRHDIVISVASAPEKDTVFTFEAFNRF